MKTSLKITLIALAIFTGFTFINVPRTLAYTYSGTTVYTGNLNVDLTPVIYFKIGKFKKRVSANKTITLTPADASRIDENGKAWFDVTYIEKNKGTDSIYGYFNNVLNFDNQELKADVRNHLAAGSTVSVKQNVALNVNAKNPILQLILDARNDVAELNENNNSFTVSVKFKGFNKPQTMSCGGSSGGDGLYSACVGDTIYHQTSGLNFKVISYDNDHIVLDLTHDQYMLQPVRMTIYKNAEAGTSLPNGVSVNYTYTETSSAYGVFLKITSGAQQPKCVSGGNIPFGLLLGECVTHTPSGTTAKVERLTNDYIVLSFSSNVNLSIPGGWVTLQKNTPSSYDTSDGKTLQFTYRGPYYIQGSSAMYGDLLITTIDTPSSCASPTVYYQGACVDPVPACESWPDYAVSCVDKIENNVRTSRYSFTCQNGYQRSGTICVPSYQNFNVTTLTASVTPGNYTTPCTAGMGKNLQLSGAISVNAPGNVTYYWEHSDGSTSAQSTIYFNGEGTQNVYGTWTLYGNAISSGWVRLRTISPNAEYSDTASFTVSCVIPDPIVTGVGTTNVTYSCPQSSPSLKFTSSITTNGAGNVTYQWVRNDGVASPLQGIDFNGAGTQTVEYTWNLSGNAAGGWARLHVVSPNSLDSNMASFGMICTSPPVLQVTNATLSVSRTNFTTACSGGFGVPFVFTGLITANGPGTVTYQWDRSDLLQGQPRSVYFSGAGTQSVSDTWTITTASSFNSSGNFSGWEKLHILTPNAVTTSGTTFGVTCTSH